MGTRKVPTFRLSYILFFILDSQTVTKEAAENFPLFIVLFISFWSSVAQGK